MKKARPILIGEKDKRPRALGRWGKRLKWVFVAFGVASCAGASMRSLDTEMRVRQAELDVSRIGHAARLFRADFGRCPAGISELAAPPEGRTPYVRSAKDPWERPYRIACPARLDPAQVDVISGGPDGDKTGEDNISSL
jgi:hypothetical protein